MVQRKVRLEGAMEKYSTNYGFAVLAGVFAGVAAWSFAVGLAVFCGIFAIVQTIIDTRRSGT